jgi:predicted metal-binding protein
MTTVIGCFKSHFQIRFTKDLVLVKVSETLEQDVLRLHFFRPEQPTGVGVLEIDSKQD